MDLQELIETRIQVLKDEGVVFSEVRAEAKEKGIYLPAASNVSRLRNNQPKMINPLETHVIKGLARLLRVSEYRVGVAMLHTLGLETVVTSDGHEMGIVGRRNRTPAERDGLRLTAEEAVRQLEYLIAQLE